MTRDFREEDRRAASRLRIYKDSETRDWLTNQVGISIELWDSLDGDDDWAFVIKAHGILEAALNHLILTEINRPELRDFVARLDTLNKATGKSALLKALDLLPSEIRNFIRKFSELRNHAVHDVRNFNLNIVKYIRDDQGELKSWKKALTCWCVVPGPDGKALLEGAMPEEFADLCVQTPRSSILYSCLLILGISLAGYARTKAFNKIIREAYENGRKLVVVLDQPIPKES